MPKITLSDDTRDYDITVNNTIKTLLDNYSETKSDTVDRFIASWRVHGATVLDRTEETILLGKIENNIIQAIENNKWFEKISRENISAANLEITNEGNVAGSLTKSWYKVTVTLDITK